jgi:hypothetical protein
MHRRLFFPLILFLMTAALVTVPHLAEAHVKWFCGVIDLRAPPVPLRMVLSPLFIGRAVTFLTLVSAGSFLDAVITRQWPGRVANSLRLEAVEDIIIRVGVGGYALSLWSALAVVPWAKAGDGAILTPDLFDRDILVTAPVQTEFVIRPRDQSAAILYSANTVFQISGAVLPWSRSRERSNWRL